MENSRRGQIKKTADMLEKRLAKDLEGMRVPGSGNMQSFKGDVQTDVYLIDSKNTEKSSISLKASDLVKINMEARESDRRGHIILTFLPDTHYAVVPKRDCFFESLEETLVVKQSKTLSKSHLSSLTKRAAKKGIIPSIFVHFEKIALGCPRDWLIIPYNVYKEQFYDF